jgi:hypothetical protein
MIASARRLPGGDQRNLYWIFSSVEDAPLKPPYALISAGQSLHWLTWETVFPKFVDSLSPSGVLAVISREWNRLRELRDRLTPIFAAYSTNRDYRPYDLIEELDQRGLFRTFGRLRTDPEPWSPTVDEYVECCHSQNGFSRERMGETAERFDQAVRQTMGELIEDGTILIDGDRLQLSVDATVVWGKPLWPYG